MAVGQACAYCASPGSVKRCSLCREVAYCSPGCQQAHWKADHKRTCSRQFTPSAPSKPAPPKNPCVNCGKEGTKYLGDQWFCSHDCTGSNLNSLTEKVKRLAQPPKMPPLSSDDKRIMDWLKGNIEAPSKPASDAPARATSTPEAPLSELQPQPGRDEQSTLDNVKSLLAAQQALPTVEPESHEVNQRTLDKVKSLLEAPQVPATEVMPKDDRKTLDKVQELIKNIDGTASAQQDTPAVFDKVKNLIEGTGTTEVKSEMAESQFTAKENQRVADWIKGICSQSPEENYAAAKRQAEAARTDQAQSAQQPKIALETDRRPAQTAQAPDITILPSRRVEPKVPEPKITILPKKKAQTKDGKAKKSKQKPETQQEAYTDEFTRQLREIEEKKEELRKANIALEKAKEKQAQMSHYMRGWLQREAAKQAEAEAEEEDVNELD